MENEKKPEEKPVEQAKVDNKAKDVKKKSNKKEKKVIVDFDKIDITTATDDEIIKSGLKKNVKFDKICYGIMALIFIMIFVPPALRTFIPKPITMEERDVAYVDMECRRTLQRDGYILSVLVKSNYREETVLNTNITYTSKKLDETAPDDYVFAEINEMNGLDFKGVTKKVEDNVYKFDIVYGDEYQAMYQNEVLQGFMYVSAAEMKFLTDKGYYCTQEVNPKRELVYIDTGLKVED